LEGWWKLLEGADGVFHTAAKVEMWGRYEPFFRANVIGTRNIITAARKAGVKRIVFTSSPSVIHDGSNLCGVDESYPYPRHFEAFYPQTKAQAEQEIVAADTPNELRSVALRPHLIWGPGDTNLVPTVMERARIGRLTRIGSGENLVDLTYIDDCVQAHLLAMRQLEENPDLVGGKAYFISQGEPVRLWEWIDRVLVAHNVPKVTKSLPVGVAMTAARVLECGAKALLAIGIERQPLLTRFLVSEMSTSHYFNINRARRDLGFTPSVTIDQALSITFPEGKPAKPRATSDV
jgi:nucleoside-diphosphate-sugar epimerase